MTTQPTDSVSQPPAAPTLELLYDLGALAIAGSMLLTKHAGLNLAMYAATSVGAVASFAIGYASLRKRRVALGPGTVRFARLWVGMMLVASLNLISGSHEPVLLFATLGLTMTLLYALGGWAGSRRA